MVSCLSSRLCNGENDTNDGDTVFMKESAEPVPETPARPDMLRQSTLTEDEVVPM